MSTPKFAVRDAAIVICTLGNSKYHHDRADDMPCANCLIVAQTAIEAALPHLLTEKDAEIERLRGVVATVDSQDMARTVAKTSWDRAEADYWNHETDHRQFDPTVTELDSDDCDRGHEWLGVVTEILTDLRTALDEDSRR